MLCANFKKQLVIVLRVKFSLQSPYVNREAKFNSFSVSEIIAPLRNCEI